MSDNQPYEPSQTPRDPNQIDDWREERREARQDWREERREARAQRNSGGNWIWGIFLILLGLGLLADNAGLFSFTNWWALFILIPAIGSFQSAWNHYQTSGGRLNAEARGSMIGGMVLTIIAFIFLFNLSFGLMWPLLLVIAGLGLLINALLPG